MKELQNKFNNLNKQYLKLDKLQKSNINNEQLYYLISLDMEFIQAKMTEIATKMELNINN